VRGSQDAAVVLLFSLVASGQIKLRRIDGWQKIAAVLSHPTPVAAWRPFPRRSRSPSSSLSSLPNQRRGAQLPRLAPSPLWARRTFSKRLTRLEPSREDPSPMLRGVARYQGTDG
jgi:hypothetical protein